LKLTSHIETDDLQKTRRRSRGNTFFRAATKMNKDNLLTRSSWFVVGLLAICCGALVIQFLIDWRLSYASGNWAVLFGIDAGFLSAVFAFASFIVMG
jgi:hypothetical protein